MTVLILAAELTWRHVRLRDLAGIAEVQLFNQVLRDSPHNRIIGFNEIGARLGIPQ